MVSNEGETRVLGFEAAPGLAEQAGSLPGEITRYLAPEVVAGQPVERSDDAFTLGAILWELLACKPLPKAGPGGHAAVIDGAQVAYDGSAFPAEIAALLKRSLVPRGQRIADAAAWHKALSQLMADAGFAATTFNLAFFMHNLFRQEIEQENREIEEEKSIEVAAAAAVPAAGAAAAAGAAPGDAQPVPPPPEPEPASRGGKGLMAALAAVLLVAALGAGWFFWLQPAREAEAEAARLAAEAAQAQESVVEEPPEPQGPTPEELQAQISEMLESRSAQMEEKLVDQYDDQIRQLQEQLVEARDAAQRAAEERERQRIAAEREAKEEAERLAAEEEARVAAEAEARQKAEEERKAKEAEADRQQLAEAQAEPEPPPVKVGDLVGMSSGVTPPELLAQPEVRYPAMGKKLAKEAEVEVRVLVDENGNVRDATLMGKKAGFGFDQAALEAAKSARYKPALKEGVRVKMYVNLTIKFDL
jgi:TonB family protein